MAPAFLNYLGFGGRDSVAEDKSPIRALPASWYTSQEMFELERRAIFSKKWLLTTHAGRLPQPGDWLKFDVTGYEIVLARDRQGKINGFHNVCRHRAFSVVEGKQGNAKIFACRYHGWSYGLDGKLAKAPKYDELEGFNKTKNNLFPVHVHVDSKNFIWINLDSSEAPEPWSNQFAGIDLQERYKQFNFEDYILDHEYQLDGSYNWKILADNFNECYHCPTTHPDLPTLADITTHDVVGELGYIRHQSVLNEDQERDGLGISSTYYFPNVSVSVLPHFMMLQRFLPYEPTKSSMHYQIFRNKNSSDKDFKLISEMYARVVSEDKALCEQVQKNLNAGIIVNGELHPRLEKGPLYFQKVDREAIRAHVELEKAAGGEIWPARQKLPGSAQVSLEDEELCAGLACQTDQKKLLW
ncbi:hypothetical protein LTR64_008456 [Lithohypha guttulata]|uniref:uncharacterized protein n=1 Tax=Lithohypha guttulata TaxID=1690604 RepID=UPI002DDEE590|nr:hypothetical protein LTR51_008790 [Lithohypha guttulata]